MPIKAAYGTHGEYARPAGGAQDSASRDRFAWVTGVSLAILVAGISSSALAQYKSDPIDANANRNFAAAQGSARGSLNYASERAKVEEYFTKFYFPEMSRSEPAALGQLGDKRFNLFRRYLYATSNSQMQSDLTEWAFVAMRRMAAPGYHPAVRYNAILTLGMLDAQYGIDTGPNRRPPKPLPKANEFLVRVVAMGADGNKVVSPPLLAGALVGLERHAMYRDGLSPDAVAAMSAAALKIATQEQPALEMDRKVHAWMRLKAAGVLAQLGNVGTNNQIHDALVKLITDGKSLDDRCATSALLAKINYDGAKIDADRAANTMLALASDVATELAKEAEEFRDLEFAGGGGGFSSRERGFYPGGEGGGGYVDEEQDNYPRRPAVARLTGLKSGLEKLKPVVSPEAQAKFDAIVAAINPAIDIAADKESIALEVAKEMVTMSAAVKSVAGVAGDGAADAQRTASFEESFEAPADAVPAADEAAPEAAPPVAAPAAAALPDAAPAGAAPPEATPADAQ